MANDIQKIIAPYNTFITYVPLRTEVPFREYLTIPHGARCFEIPPRASLDPYTEAKKAITYVQDAPAAILIPGRAFDAHGTRHGQGGGWYDRFLSHIPRSWLRIGMCYERQFSSSSLPKNPWDQEMDVVCVVNGNTLSVYDTRTSRMHRITAIAAIGKHTRVLGKDNDLVWNIPSDLERFRNITRDHPIIMGRKTWESLPPARRPLPKRTNIVVTRNPAYEAPGALVVTSVGEALEKAKTAPGAEEIFIIGGGAIYEAALPYADRLCLTLVDDESEGDVHFPAYPQFTRVVEHELHPEHTPPYEYVTLERS